MKRSIAIFSIIFLSLFGANQAFSHEVAAKGSLTGAFSSWGKSSLEGDWEIQTVDGKNYIVLADNFKAKKGPDVKIFLSPLDADAITGKNAAKGSAFIYLINDFEGSSRIEIPEDINVNDYKSLVFHCEEYSKLWGVSPL